MLRPFLCEFCAFSRPESFLPCAVRWHTPLFILADAGLLPECPIKPLEELFRAKVIRFLESQNLLPPERARSLRSWVHSGFNVHAGDRVEPEAKAQLADLAQYILRNPFSVEKMTMESPTDNVIYRSRMSVKINRKFEVFSPTDFLAAITQHIPDKGVQMVRYYGWYSNKMRGGRQPSSAIDATSKPLRPNIIPPPPRRLPSKKWRDIIMQVWPTRSVTQSVRT